MGTGELKVQTKLVVEGTPEEIARVAKMLSAGGFPVEGVAATRNEGGEQLELFAPREEAPAKEELTLDDVKDLLKKVTAEKSLDAAKVIMLKYAPAPSAIKPEDYASIAKELRGALRVAH
jgi:hypothetical protein